MHEVNRSHTAVTPLTQISSLILVCQLDLRYSPAPARVALPLSASAAAPAPRNHPLRAGQTYRGSSRSPRHNSPTMARDRACYSRTDTRPARRWQRDRPLRHQTHCSPSRAPQLLTTFASRSLQVFRASQDECPNRTQPSECSRTAVVRRPGAR